MWHTCKYIFNIYAWPLWEANKNGQFILYLYVIVIYCISYLTKVDKSITHEMQYILDNYKFEQIEAFEQIKEKEMHF
jgi:hypothetical protein